MKIIYSSISLIAILALSVSAKADPSGSHFSPAEFENPTAVGRVLLFGQTYPLEFESEKGTSDPEHRRYRVQFGKLTEARFKEIRTLLHSGQPSVYSPTASYELSQFLPRFAQAVDGHHFVSTPTQAPVLSAWLAKQNEDEVDKTDLGVRAVTNCWQTALEFLRGDRETFDTYYPPQAAAAAVFNDGSLFKRVLASQLQPLDAIFIFQKNEQSGMDEARHAAIHLGGNLFFEKTGSAENFLYRILPLTEILKTYPLSLYKIRYLRRTAKPLPAPADFSIAFTNPDLAQDINDPIVKSVSVELAYGQGLLGYSFFSVEPFRLVQTPQGWEAISASPR